MKNVSDYFGCNVFDDRVDESQTVVEGVPVTAKNY